MVRKAAALLLCSVMMSGAADAQFAGLPDVIAQTVAGMNAPRPDKCYDGRWTPSEESIAKGPERVEAAMANYRAYAAAGTDLRRAVGSEGMRRWQLDGKTENVAAVRDPFLPRTAKLERLFIRPGNASAFYRVQWRALAADGSEIGIYDGVMFWTSKKFMSLDLYTPGAEVRPVPDTPFCQVPGDVEKWTAAKAERAAKKAAKAAARAAH